MRLKELRKEKEKKQEDIAKILNVATSTYGGYELEANEPTIDTLCKLADYYNVSLDYLVGRQFRNDLGYLTDEQVNFIKLYLSLTRENQNKLFGYAMALMGEQ